MLSRSNLVLDCLKERRPPTRRLHSGRNQSQYFRAASKHRHIWMINRRNMTPCHLVRRPKSIKKSIENVFVRRRSRPKLPIAADMKSAHSARRIKTPLTCYLRYKIRSERVDRQFLRGNARVNPPNRVPNTILCEQRASKKSPRVSGSCWPSPSIVITAL